ncbi:hypothetical protein KY347_02475 [Candidatus Woesearchaeota archaeon]|nr:hypothetical protein [Candidatus Woesearchaeota archaeon]
MPKKLKDFLGKKLTKKELSLIPSSYDIVGSILIFSDFPRELVKKEKLIGEALLGQHKQIKSVFKKTESYSGKYRTPKLKLLAGENNKETIYKENNIRLKLNVEKVYFSPRLSEERKRITQQVKENEDILVMFSGCAPYPCVISKNTRAREIFGIETNPLGHKYGMENLKLNRIHNVVLINGDVRKVMPHLFHYLIGLKSSDKEIQLEKRLKYHPVVMELHLFDDDLFAGKERLEKTIGKLKSKGINVVLHMPFCSGGKRYSLAKKDASKELIMLGALGEMCKKHHIKAIVHPAQDTGEKEIKKMLVSNLKRLEKYYDYFYFENSSKGIFSKTSDIIRIGRKSGMKNMCIDTCHLFLAYRDNNKIARHIASVRKEFNTYFHLNDCDLKTHSCQIGRGYIDFSKILPYVNLGVTEITSADENNPREMIKSYLELEHSLKKFDRILMPLPKGAENFLGLALGSIKKNGIIHLYSFAEENKYEHITNSIKTECKKSEKQCKILKITKCGQFSPRVYRICVDFRVK